MKLFDINGEIVRANVCSDNFPIRGKASKSALQQRVGKMLLDKFPLYSILEEWTIPSSKLSLDFFIPQLMMAIEADGGQHKKFNKFFHGTIDAFRKQKERDNRKNHWCEINGIEMIRVENELELEELL